MEPGGDGEGNVPFNGNYYDDQVNPGEVCDNRQVLDKPVMGANFQQGSSGVWSYGSFYGGREGDVAAASWENNPGTETDYDCDDDSDFNEAQESVSFEEEDEDEEECVEESCEDGASDIYEVVEDLDGKFESVVKTTIKEAERFLDDPQLLMKLAVVHHSAAFTPGDFSTPPEPPKVVKPPVLHVETQTEDDQCLTRSSGTLVPNDLAAEQAQSEIVELRGIRESILTELQKMNNQSPDNQKSSRAISHLSESIEVIDQTILLKSELICPSSRFASSLDPSSPDECLNLVTNHDTLSTSDLQRLMCSVFSKSVELRYCTEELEKNLEKAQKKHNDLSKKLKKEKKHTRELQDQYQTRISQFLKQNADYSYYSKFRKMEEQLQQSRKRQSDLEMSLTALLVRHGYLLDGVDYDVQQVVRMLGIDERQISAAQMEAKGRVTRRGGISAPPEDTPDEASGYSPAGPSHQTERKSDRERSRSTRDRDADHYHHRRKDHFPVPPPQPQTEVKREKGKLVIQQGSSRTSDGGHHHSSKQGSSRHRR